jgi:hypothetical protein
LSYFYNMDIRQELINFQIVDFSSYTEKELDAFFETIKEKEDEIIGIARQMTEMRSRIVQRKWKIQAEERAVQDQTMAQTMAEKGYKPGAIYYIDRHDGLYVVDSVNSTHVFFKRRMEGSHTVKTVNMPICKIDPRLTPLRTQGPYEVGDMVVRNDIEFKVEGYLGYRMVLSHQRREEKIYTIVQKKDERTYRSIII